MYDLHKDKKSYSVLNTHKAMLLQTLPFFGNTWCSNVFLITKFMKGIFNICPALPRYRFTWDVSTVLKFLRTLYPLNKLSMKMLTLKVSALIALSCAPRAQTLVSLNLEYMKTSNNKVYFVFPNHLKTTNKHNNYQLVLEHFHDEKLCVMHTVLFYVQCTEALRKANNLLVSYVTYKSVTTSTVARWLREVLQLSGIDIGIFKAHSFRSAATSAAYNKGCSVVDILKTADWKSDKNFYKFYYRTVEEKAVSFNDAVFGSK